MSQSIPTALSQQYVMQEANEDIVLYEGPMRFEQGSEIYEGSGRVVFRWLPGPQVDGQFELKDNHDLGVLGLTSHLQFGPAKLYLVEGGQWLILNVTKINASSVHGFIEPVLVGDSKASLVEVRFDVANLRPLRGSAIGFPNRGGWAGRNTACFDDWRFELDAIRPTERNKQVLADVKATGGYGVTHTGHMYKSDNAAFTLNDVQDVLLKLHDFLSLCCGWRTGPLLSVGLGSSGTECWKEWGPTRVSRWRNNYSWCCEHTDEAIPEGLPRYILATADKQACAVLRLAISIYSECNGGGESIDAELIVLQTAFELLGWHILTTAGGLSEDKVKSLKAHQLIRRVLTHCKIPTNIPTRLEALVAGANGKDGPSIFARTRNALVHPTKDNRQWVEGQGDQFLWQVHELGLWYLELIVLSLIDYQGKYLNRLEEGWVTQAVGLVPWAKEKRKPD